MLIFPGGLLLQRLFFRREPAAPGNTLGRTALESTIAMVGPFFAAWILMDSRPELAFPLAAIGVGLHYFAFRTVYGDAIYWIFAAVLSAVGFAGAVGLIPGAVTVAIIFGAIEIAFGIVLTLKYRNAR